MRAIERLLLFGWLASALTAGNAYARIVVHADRLLDVDRGAIIRNAAVVVDGERIAALGDADGSDVQHINLGDVTLLPGLIDLHTHLAWDLEDGWVTQPVLETPPDWTCEGHATHVVHSTPGSRPCAMCGRSGAL
jgi:imidazolonepropionase-like amidohydrolase